MSWRLEWEETSPTHKVWPRCSLPWWTSPQSTACPSDTSSGPTSPSCLEPKTNSRAMFSSRQDILMMCSHVAKFSPLFSPIKISVSWVPDPLSPKFYSLLQNNIGQNFGDKLNLVTCEHFINAWTCEMLGSVHTVGTFTQNNSESEMFF